MEKVNKNDFIKFSLSDFLEEIGEDAFNELVSDFSCPQDDDIVYFLKHKAVPFEKAEFHSSKTYLVGFINSLGKFSLCGYYTLSNNPFVLSDKMSKSKRKSLTEGKTNKSAISAVLIGQLSKKYSHGLNYAIDGDDLLAFALETISDVQHSVGLDLVYLECKDTQKLRKFYERNMFELYVDANNNPIYTGKNSTLLCYVAKYKNIKIIK